MASRSDNKGGGGCAALLLFLLVVAAIIWVFSTVGHFLGLTPSFGEATNRPDGWVSRNYTGVFWGYLLTVLLMTVAAVVAWLALVAATDDNASRAGYWLPRVGAAGLCLLVIALVLPIGERTGVKAANGIAGEGNVPNVVGKSAAEATSTLEGEGLTSQFDETPLDDARCKVIEQRPEAGRELEQGEPVSLRCEAPVPDVLGERAETADGRLRDGGFTPELVNAPSDYDLTRCRVRSQRPTGQAPPFARVSLRLNCRKPPPEPEPELPPEPEPDEDCDPNYSGACVPPYPPDVDCPDVDGSVEVTGEDVHALDREGDGNACEE